MTPAPRPSPDDAPSLDEVCAEIEAVIVRADLGGDPVGHILRVLRNTLLALAGVTEQLAALQARADSTPVLTPEQFGELKLAIRASAWDAVRALHREHLVRKLPWVLAWVSSLIAAWALAKLG